MSTSGGRAGAGYPDGAEALDSGWAGPTVARLRLGARLRRRPGGAGVGNCKRDGI